jgi:hypothetical protein
MQRQQSNLAYQFFMLTLAFMLVMLLSIACYRAPLARATGSSPTITWHQNLTTPGRYHGYPWGTPNEDVVAFGQGFSAGQRLKLVLAAGNSNSDPTVCTHGLISVDQVTATSNGEFSTYFRWPLTLNKVNQEYSMCALTANGVVVSSRNDPGPFVVATASPPDINVWPTTVAAGGTLTVTGQNWVLPHEVTVNFSNPHTEIGVGGIKVIVVKPDEIKNGMFRISFTIPKHLPPGTYTVVAGVDLFVVGVSSRFVNVVVTATGK